MTLSNLGDLSQAETSSSLSSWARHEHGWRLNNKNNPPAVLNFMQSKTGNRDTFPPPHISQSSSRHGDTAWGLMQIFSEVTFSADTPLSLRTKFRTHAQGSVIYRFTEKHVLPFVKSSAQCELLTWEFDQLRLGQRVGGNTVLKPESTDW